MPCTLDWFPGEVTDGARLVGAAVVEVRTSPDRLASPPEVVMAREPAVTSTEKGPSSFQVPAGPLTTFAATVVPFMSTLNVWVALSSQV